MRIAAWTLALLLASCLAQAEEKVKAASPPSRQAQAAEAAERKAKLVAGVKDFTMTLQFVGIADLKVPRWSMTLSTQPIQRRRSERFHADVQITEAEALKIIDWLEKDGVLATAMERMRGDLATPNYALDVTGGGVHLETALGWNADMLRRLDSMATALEGDAAKAMKQLRDALADVRPKLESAERVEKLKADLDRFALQINYVGPITKPGLFSLTLSTRPMEYDRRVQNALDAVITKEAAAKLIDHLAKSGVFERAVQGFKQPPGGPCYIVSVSGGATCMEVIGWGADCLEQLGAIHALLDGNAAEQLGKLTARLKEALPAPAKDGEIRPVP